jgi:hypothetical protein
MSEGSIDGVGEELEDVPALLSEGVHDSHDACGEEGAAIALGTEALPAPEDERSQLALGVVV